jgi:hypothetical protein
MPNKSDILILDVDDTILPCSKEWERHLLRLKPDLKLAYSLTERLQYCYTHFVNDHFIDHEEFFNIAKNEDFYLNCKPYEKAKRMIESLIQFQNSKKVQIHFVTHCMNDKQDPMTATKRAIILEMMKEYTTPYFYHELNLSESKAEFIAENISDEISVMIDDAPKNLVDVLLNEKIKVSNYIFPKFPHNSYVPSNIETLARLKSTKISHFDLE